MSDTRLPSPWNERLSKYEETLLQIALLGPVSPVTAHLIDADPRGIVKPNIRKRQANGFPIHGSEENLEVHGAVVEVSAGQGPPWCPWTRTLQKSVGPEETP
jgi:hypothetical protein